MKTQCSEIAAQARLLKTSLHFRKEDLNLTTIFKMEYIGIITSITLLQEADSLILLMRQMVDHNGSSSWRLPKREKKSILLWKEMRNVTFW